jgi:hypothetical protein
MKLSRRRLLDLVFASLVLVGLILAIWLGGWNRGEEDRSERNYSLIEEGLYQGGWVSEPPPETTAVLNLCEFEDPYQCEVHAWHKIRDAAPAPNLDWLRKQVEFVDGERRAGRTVYVHCWAGISRSGMVVVAYLMFKHDWTRDQALEFVRSKRPMTSPNPAFMELLLEWERSLKGSSPAKKLSYDKKLICHSPIWYC